MPFTNELILPEDQEKSQFAVHAAKQLNLPANGYNKWTIDRDRKLALHRSRSGGNDPDSYNHDQWDWISESNRCWFTTNITHQEEISETRIRITRTISFPSTPHYSRPDANTISRIKEALIEYKDSGMHSKYKECTLTLIEQTSGKEF